MFHRSSLIPALILLSSCAAPQTTRTTPEAVAPVAAPDWTFDKAAPMLVAQSCPEGTTYVEPLPLEITAEPIPLGPADLAAERLPEGVHFAGGWELNASHEMFGGLSDLAITSDGDLLAVVDDGAFVWIGLEDGAPDGTGKLAYMQGTDGELLQGKSLGDAEGLTIRDHLAVVSFERTHRISAFALDACGAAAREALISALPATYNGRKVDANSGAEALTIRPDGTIQFGYERVGRHAPIGRIDAPDAAIWTNETAPEPEGFAFVSFDSVRFGGIDQTYWLFRAYDPIRGNRNVLRWGRDLTSIRIASPLASDNYEGVAAEDLGGGITRIWMVSDDNFNPAQRTLLLAFDIAAPSE